MRKFVSTPTLILLGMGALLVGAMLLRSIGMMTALLLMLVKFTFPILMVGGVVAYLSNRKKGDIIRRD